MKTKFIEYLKWDSDFFGFNIGKVFLKESEINPLKIKRIISEAKKNRIKCLYLETPFASLKTLNYFCANKFLLVDLRLTLEKTLIKQKKIRLKNIISKKKAEDYCFLEKIAIQLSRQSRFNRDAKFGGLKSIQLYKEWLRKSFYGSLCNHLFTFKKNKVPAGFLTVKIKGGIPFINLIGVAANMQRKGIGSKLVDFAELRLLKDGYKTIRVVTQGQNINALKFYQAKNFKIERITLFFHKWFI